MEVRERISFFRKQKGITVTKLATMSGLSQSFIRDLENGEKKPSVETLSYICKALNISMRDFFDDETATSLKDNPLLQQIYRLTPKQQKSLSIFLADLEEKN